MPPQDQTARPTFESLLGVRYLTRGYYTHSHPSADATVQPQFQTSHLSVHSQNVLEIPISVK